MRSAVEILAGLEDQRVDALELETDALQHLSRPLKMLCAGTHAQDGAPLCWQV
jgi:hypothetical protein